MADIEHSSTGLPPSNADVSVNSLHAVGAVSASQMDAQAINIHNTEQTQGVNTDESGTTVSDVGTGKETAIFADKIKFNGSTDLEEAHVTKLNGIEAGADVTDAENVAAAGAVMVGAGAQAFIRSLNNGRLSLVSAVLGDQIQWDGYEIGLYNPTDARWESVIPSSAPFLTNISNDLDGNKLLAGHNYDIYLQWSSATAATPVAKKWTDDLTRAVTPALWNGVLCYDNSTDAGKSRRYLGFLRPYVTALVAAAWSGATTYKRGDRVTSGGHYYISHQEGNLNHAVSDAAWWQDMGTSDDGRGVFCNQVNRRLILNAYNQRWETVGLVNPHTGSTSQASGTPANTWYPWYANAQGDSAWHCDFLSDGLSAVQFDAIVKCYTAGGYDTSVSIAIDSLTTPLHAYCTGSCAINVTWTVAFGMLRGYYPPPGYHYAIPMYISTIVNANLSYYYGTPCALFMGLWRG